MTDSGYRGRIISGEGYASQNYKVMIAEIAKEFPAVGHFGQHGTINVRLETAIETSQADHWTKPVTWNPVAGLTSPRIEGFGFTKIKFKCLGLYDAWMIFPEGHDWTYSGEGVEVIAAYIHGVKPGLSCSIHLDHWPLVPRPAWFGEHYGLK
jgi:hypothetical protein